MQEALRRQAARQWQLMCRRLLPPHWPTPLQQCLGATAAAAAVLRAALEQVGNEGVLQHSEMEGSMLSSVGCMLWKESIAAAGNMHYSHIMLSAASVCTDAQSIKAPGVVTQSKVYASVVRVLLQRGLDRYDGYDIQSRYHTCAIPFALEASFVVKTAFLPCWVLCAIELYKCGGNLQPA